MKSSSFNENKEVVRFESSLRFPLGIMPSGTVFSVTVSDKFGGIYLGKDCSHNNLVSLYKKAVQEVEESGLSDFVEIELKDISISENWKDKVYKDIETGEFKTETDALDVVKEYIEQLKAEVSMRLSLINRSMCRNYVQYNQELYRKVTKNFQEIDLPAAYLKHKIIYLKDSPILEFFDNELSPMVDISSKAGIFFIIYNSDHDAENNRNLVGLNYYVLGSKSTFNENVSVTGTTIPTEIRI